MGGLNDNLEPAREGYHDHPNHNAYPNHHDHPNYHAHPDHHVPSDHPNHHDRPNYRGQDSPEVITVLMSKSTVTCPSEIM